MDSSKPTRVLLALWALGWLAACTSLSEAPPPGLDLSGEWVLDEAASDPPPNIDAIRRREDRRIARGRQKDPAASGAFVAQDFPVLAATRLVIEQDRQSMGVYYYRGEDSNYLDFTWGERRARLLARPHGLAGRRTRHPLRTRRRWRLGATDTRSWRPTSARERLGGHGGREGPQRARIRSTVAAACGARGRGTANHPAPGKPGCYGLDITGHFLKHPSSPARGRPRLSEAPHRTGTVAGLGHPKAGWPPGQATT